MSRPDEPRSPMCIRVVSPLRRISTETSHCRRLVLAFSRAQMHLGQNEKQRTPDQRQIPRWELATNETRFSISGERSTSRRTLSKASLVFNLDLKMIR